MILHETGTVYSFCVNGPIFPKCKEFDQSPAQNTSTCCSHRDTWHRYWQLKMAKKHFTKYYNYRIFLTQQVWSHFQKTYNKFIIKPNFMKVFCDKVVFVPLVDHRNMRAAESLELKPDMMNMFFKSAFHHDCTSEFMMISSSIRTNVHTFLVKLQSEMSSANASVYILPCRTLWTELIKLDFPAPAGP